MKKIYILFITLFIYGCSDLDPERLETVNLQEYGLNTSLNRSKLQNMIEDSFEVKEYRRTFDAFISSDYYNEIDESFKDDYSITSLINVYEACSSCASSQREFLIPLLKDLSDVGDNQLLQLLETYESKVYAANMSDSVKSDLLFLIYAFKLRAESELKIIEENKSRSGFWSCFRSTVGRAVGEGIAVGFIGGCIQGAWATGIAGTAVFPVIGTVTGAVSGCVAGGAVGAVLGAAGGAALSAAKCVF